MGASPEFAKPTNSDVRSDTAGWFTHPTLTTLNRGHCGDDLRVYGPEPIDATVIHNSDQLDMNTVYGSNCLLMRRWFQTARKHLRMLVPRTAAAYTGYILIMVSRVDPHDPHDRSPLRLSRYGTSHSRYVLKLFFVVLLCFFTSFIIPALTHSGVQAISGHEPNVVGSNLRRWQDPNVHHYRPRLSLFSQTLVII